MKAGNDVHSLALRGLRADNLLAYLAALGTLRVLAMYRMGDDPRLAWHVADGTWQPVIWLSNKRSEAEVAQWLYENLQGQEASPQFIMSLDPTKPAENLTILGSTFRELASKAAEQSKNDDRSWADYCAAYGTEAFDLEKEIEDTGLRTMSGAGHQHFLTSIRRLAQRPRPASKDNSSNKGRRGPSTSRSSEDNTGDDGTTKDQFQRALFSAWDYTDPGPAMRWDPRDDRRYALRADDPSGSRFDPIRTMRGANRLAIEALPLFPTFPTAKRAQTVGVHREDRSYVIRCPVWSEPLCVDPVRFLLAHRLLGGPTEPRNRKELTALGVVEIFSATRLNVGRMVNFAPSIPLWGTLPKVGP